MSTLLKPLRELRSKVVMLIQGTLTYNLATSITNLMDTLFDNELIAIPVVVILTYYMVCASVYLKNEIEIVKQQYNIINGANKEITLSKPSLRRLSLVPMMYVDFLIEIAILLLSQRLTTIFSGVLIDLLPNSSSGSVESDTTLQILPPTLFVLGLFFLCAYAVDAL